MVNAELGKLHKWLCANRLTLNVKTNFLIFHPYNKPIKEVVTLKINKIAIAEEQFVKYLGVLIDSTLSWKQHINELSKKIAVSLGIMYKLRPFVKTNILLNVYLQHYPSSSNLWYPGMGFIC